MPVEDDHPVMVAGWGALLGMQARGRVNARRQAPEIIRRPVRRSDQPQPETDVEVTP